MLVNHGVLQVFAGLTVCDVHRFRVLRIFTDIVIRHLAWAIRRAVSLRVTGWTAEERVVRFPHRRVVAAEDNLGLVRLETNIDLGTVASHVITHRPTCLDLVTPEDRTRLLTFPTACLISLKDLRRAIYLWFVHAAFVIAEQLLGSKVRRAYGNCVGMSGITVSRRCVSRTNLRLHNWKCADL